MKRAALDLWFLKGTNKDLLAPFAWTAVGILATDSSRAESVMTSKATRRVATYESISSKPAALRCVGRPPARAPRAPKTDVAEAARLKTMFLLLVSGATSARRAVLDAAYRALPTLPIPATKIMYQNPRLIVACKGKSS